jgi:hypothetical protein
MRLCYTIVSPFVRGNDPAIRNPHAVGAKQGNGLLQVLETTCFALHWALALYEGQVNTQTYLRIGENIFKTIAIA